MTARLMQRPDIRLDRLSWDGRLAVETITRRGIEAFAQSWPAFVRDQHPHMAMSTRIWPKADHDRIVREWIEREGLAVEEETP